MVITIRYTFDPTSSKYFEDYGSITTFNPAGCLTTFPVFVFSFTTQINLLQCFEELELPTLRRMHKVLAKQHFICFSIYLTIGVFGYLSFPKDDPSASSYLLRYDPVAHTDILAVTSSHEAVTLLILVIFVAQPFNFLPTRETFEYLILGTDHAPTKTWLHVVLTLCTKV